MDLLPVEIWTEIFGHLPLPSLIDTRLVSRTWHDLSLQVYRQRFKKMKIYDKLVLEVFHKPRHYCFSCERSQSVLQIPLSKFDINNCFQLELKEFSHDHVLDLCTKCLFKHCPSCRGEHRKDDIWDNDIHLEFRLRPLLNHPPIHFFHFFEKIHYGQKLVSTSPNQVQIRLSWPDLENRHVLTPATSPSSLPNQRTYYPRSAKRKRLDRVKISIKGFIIQTWHSLHDLNETVCAINHYDLRPCCCFLTSEEEYSSEHSERSDDSEEDYMLNPFDRVFGFPFIQYNIEFYGDYDTDDFD